MFQRKVLSLSLIIVSLITVTACVSVPPASLPAKPPDISRSSEQEPALEPKTASSVGGAPKVTPISDQAQVSADQAVAGQVVELPPMVPSSWKGDLRTLPPGKSEHRLKKQEGKPEVGEEAEVAREEEEMPPLPAQEYVLDTVAQTQTPVAAMPAPLSNFLGLTFSTWGDGWPPDPNGDVGPVYYIQTVNTSVGIFDKSTGAQVSAFSFDTLMSQGFSSTHPCYNKNYGDPVVVWDPAADRWFISDFAFSVDSSGNPISPTYECIAVSKTSDPVSGGWYFYALASNDYFPDYPKMGIWPDGLYITANMFAYTGSGSFQLVRAWALNKTQMEAGQTASVQSVNLPATISGVSVFSALPSTYHVVTGAPPAGRENFIASIWSSKLARVWKWHIDWTAPANSSFTGPSNVTLSSWNQAPSTVAELGGNSLDTLGERLMMQAQYTNMGGVESLWLTHTVANAGATSLAAPRWYQINVTDGTVVTSAPIQQSTWVPDASYSRWMGSLAVDTNGNMALGYSRASSTAYPAIYYAGRLASDPAGTLGQSESLLHQGLGYQCCTFSNGSTNSRWGDYSAMTIDPDGCTFWYTTEYYDSKSTTNAGNNWQTRIGSFRFAGCSVTPDFNLSAAPATQNACAGSDAAYTVTLNALNGFNSPVTLNATSLPAGTTAAFAPNPTTPPGSSTLTVGNTAAASAGTYNITLTGTSGALSHAADVTLNLATDLPAAAALTAPADGSTGLATTPTFTWNAVAGATSYDIQIATDAAFGSVVASATGLTSASFSPVSALSYDIVYYWRVNTVNGCGSKLSTVFAFRTAGSAVCVDVIGNGGFESGRNVSWSESTSRNRNIVVNVTGARTGSWYSRLGGANSENAQVWQAPAISASVTTATLTYWYQILSTDVCNYDFGYLKIAGTTQTTYNLCGATNMSAYVKATHDMTSLRDTSPEIRFQATTDTTIASTLRIDDVALNVCTNSASTTADYSDLPASYGVAWHTGNGTLRLGSNWDADSSFAANADNGRDDDGVSFSNPLVAGAGEILRLNVQGTPSSGRWVRAWFDWNNDGTFGAGELVFEGAVANGNNDLSLTIPAAIVDVVRYRVRLYDSGAAPNAGAWGGAAGGEVEDGLLPCVASAAISGMTISDLGDDQVQLVWTVPAGAARYQVWRALNDPHFIPGADCSSPGVYTCAETTATSYPDNVAADNPTYVVRAISTCGGYSDAAYQRVGRFRFSLIPGQ